METEELGVYPCQSRNDVILDQEYNEEIVMANNCGEVMTKIYRGGDLPESDGAIIVRSDKDMFGLGLKLIGGATESMETSRVLLSTKYSTALEIVAYLMYLLVCGFPEGLDVMCDKDAFEGNQIEYSGNAAMDIRRYIEDNIEKELVGMSSDDKEMMKAAIRQYCIRARDRLNDPRKPEPCKKKLTAS